LDIGGSRRFMEFATRREQIQAEEPEITAFSAAGAA
jgi:hypothetical protein